MKTYQDVVEHISDVFQVEKQGRFQRNIRRAIDEAYRRIGQESCWSFYRRRMALLTRPVYSQGSVAFDASSLEVTLSGGTWPAYAGNCVIRIGNAQHPVEQRVSGTVLALGVLSNPGVDVPAGTSYQLYQYEYRLPSSFRRLISVYDVDSRRPLDISSDPSEHSLLISAYGSRPGYPIRVAVRGVAEYPGAMSLVFSPPPDSRRMYDILFESSPRPLLLPEKYSVGTVSVSGASVIGSGVDFPDAVDGAVLRLSKNGVDEPTGPFGAVIDGQFIDNPAYHETTVARRVSSTELVLSEESPSPLSDVKYSLSDPIDIEEGALYTAFLRLAEASFARIVDREDRRERLEIAEQALLLAREADIRANPGTPYSHWYDPHASVYVSH